ncbi:MAG: hypothetical protein ACI8ZM_001703 [Crocinitomix sp.]|jgi:hypothetical protein
MSFLYQPFILLFSLVCVFSNTSIAQVDGNNAYLFGKYVEIAFDTKLGKECTDSFDDSGFHKKLAPGAHPLKCGLVADPNKIGWDPLFFLGNSFATFAPENGFSIEIDGINYSNNWVINTYNDQRNDPYLPTKRLTFNHLQRGCFGSRYFSSCAGGF